MATGLQGWLMAGAGAATAGAVAVGALLLWPGETPKPPSGPVPLASAPEKAAPGAAPAEAATDEPRFDHVRIEADGRAVIAGHAAPGARVTLLVDGAPIAEETAGPTGQFALITRLPLSQERQQLQLVVETDGTRKTAMLFIEPLPGAAADPSVVADAVPPLSGPPGSDGPGEVPGSQPDSAAEIASGPGQAEAGAASGAEASTAPAADAPAGSDAAGTGMAGNEKAVAAGEGTGGASEQAEPAAEAAGVSAVETPPALAGAGAAADAGEPAVAVAEARTATGDLTGAPPDAAVPQAGADPAPGGQPVAADQIAVSGPGQDGTEPGADSAVQPESGSAAVTGTGGQAAGPAGDGAGDPGGDVLASKAPRAGNGLAPPGTLSPEPAASPLDTETVGRPGAGSATRPERVGQPDAVLAGDAGGERPLPPTDPAPGVTVGAAPAQAQAVAEGAAPAGAAGTSAEGGASGRPQAPRVLLADETGVRVLQSGEPPQVASQAVVLDSISYAPDGAVMLSGRGGADRYVRIYIDNSEIVTAAIGADGHWQTDLPDVDKGVYTLRVDELTPAGEVVSRTETPFQREDAEAVAAEFDAAAGETAQPVTVVVQPGNTLWGISRGAYGRGSLYVRVFEANRSRIRNPHLIYPGQVFDMPQVPR